MSNLLPSKIENDYKPQSNKETPLPDKTIEALERLGGIIMRIRARIKKEGNKVVDGKLVPLEDHEKDN